MMNINEVRFMRFLALSTLIRPFYSFATHRPVRRFHSSFYWSAATVAYLRPRPILGQPQYNQHQALATCNMAGNDNANVVTGYLNAADAAALDVELMTAPGFSLEQLMELAGLSCAEATFQVVQEKKLQQKPKILIVCGPGNNGGDGLVAARHLVMFGYECHVVYPKQSKKTHFINLLQQCDDVGVPVSTTMPQDLSGYSAIMDAIFGFSFKGEPREPFKTILQQIKAASNGGVLTISVDVPSGWHVDEGDVAKTGFTPDVLISLTTPKHCSNTFKGRHFVGGRFLPPKLADKYKVKVRSTISGSSFVRRH